MKKLALILAFSSISLANQIESKAESLRGIKPFVGIMVGTLTQTITRTQSQLISQTDSFVQGGFWGGLEFNFRENLGARVYANVITTTLGTYASTTQSISQAHMIFSGNADLIYRPTQKIGIFIGLGLGDTLTGYTISGAGSKSNIENYFTIMGNMGVQYNINVNNILELGVIINQQLVFTVAPNYIEKLYAPASIISYSIVGKYAYRF